MKLDKNIKYVIMCWVVMSTIGFLGLVSFWIWRQKEIDKYPLCKSRDEIKGVVKYKEKGKAGCFIIFDDGRRQFLLFSHNGEYEKSELCENISIGDTLFKDSFSDTILVKGKNSKRFFLYDQTINNYSKK